MLALLFVLLVVAGFLFHFLSTWGGSPYTIRIAWGCWLVASLIWAVGRVGM